MAEKTMIKQLEAMYVIALRSGWQSSVCEIAVVLNDIKNGSF